MTIEVTDSRTHGLTAEEWVTHLHCQNYRDTAATALREIAESPRASGADRITALTLLSHGMTCGVLPEDPDYPKYSVRVLTEIAKGAPRRRWYHRWIERRMSERLHAIRVLLNTAASFVSAARRGEPSSGLLS